MPYYVVRFLGSGNTKFYHTREDCPKVERRPLREIADTKGLHHCKYCAARDRKGAA